MSDRDIYQRVAHLEEEATDLLARVRDLELVVATEAKPRIVGRELTPEQAAARDALREALRPAVERELAKLTDQRRQQAAQESQEQAPAPGLAPEDTGTATPRLTQRQRLVRADWVLVWAQRHEGDRRRHDVVVALDWLREWADEAGIDTDDRLLPSDPDWHLREARKLIREELEDDPRSELPMRTAIAHLKALLPTLGLLTLEPEPEPEQATPDPDDLLTLAMKHVDRARDGDACIVDRDCPLVDRLRIDHCDREHVRQALGLLRQWQDAAGVDKRDYSAHVHWTSPEAQLSAAAWSIEYGLRWAHERGTCVGLAIARLERWQAQQPDDDVISAEILDADAAAEMPTLPPDPTPTQRAGQVIHHLGLAMMGQDPGPLHWVNLARWELQGWPGREPLAVARSWSADYPPGWLLADAISATVSHINTPTSHATMAIACLDEWLRREVQA